MSSEPVKSVEIDCPINPYSHHHQPHHHHHHHHHVIALHHTHNHSRIEVPSQIKSPQDDIEDDEGGEDDDDELNESKLEKIRCLAQNKLNDCNELIRCKSTQFRHPIIEQDETSIGDLSPGFLTGSCNGISGGQVSSSETSDRYDLATSTIASSTSTSPTSMQSSSPPSSSSSSDSSSSLEDPDDEDIHEDRKNSYGDLNVRIDEAIRQPIEAIVGHENDDLDQEGCEEDDCDDILDPVGNHSQNNLEYNQSAIMITNDCYKITPLVDDPTLETASDDEAEEEDEEEEEEEDEDEDDDEDDEDDDDADDDDDDVSFDENDESEHLSDHTSKLSTTHLSDNSDILDSERMLEVTRKLVRSTERDPDRDLRKQVLLKTAIRKLPHFLEYHHYSDSFDQSFQLHSANMTCNINEENNVSGNCLSTAQYYEHQHNLNLNHHVESQPKSFYHSVQPNAIQMSTTSLRMLDLNDDQEAEPNTIIANDHQQHMSHHHMGQYVNEKEVQNDVQTSLKHKQLPHDYATHSQQQTLNMYHYSHHSNDRQNSQHIDSASNDLSEHHDQNSNVISGADDEQQRAIQELAVTSYTQEARTNMIAQHESMDNLYQPMSGNDMIDCTSTPVSDGPPSLNYPINYSGVADIVQTHDASCPPQEEKLDESSETKTFSNLDDAIRGQQRIASFPHTCSDDQSALDVVKDCMENKQTIAESYFCDDLDTTKQISDFVSVRHTEVSSIDNSLINESILSETALIQDQSALLETSGSSERDSDLSDTSRRLINGFDGPNETADDVIGNASLLETSLNSTNDYHHSSHDSGVALFSPRSNKRSSSSIGLDDEMDIDHLGDLVPMSQGSNSGTSMNHCKRLRKREILD